MVARVGPVGLDALAAEEGNGDLTVRRPGAPAIEGLQDEREAPPSRFRREVPRQQASGGAKIIEAGEPPQMRQKMLRIDDGIGQETHGVQQGRARNDELKTSASLLKEEMLGLTVCKQQGRAAGDVSQTEDVRPGWRIGRDGPRAEDVRALVWIPEDGRIGMQ